MNYYVVGTPDLTKYLMADGSWTEDYNEAEQLTLEAAVERQVEMIQKEIITELFEVPLLAEGMYQAIHARVDDLQARLEAAGVTLTTNIGAGDETTWTMEFAGFTLTMKLAGPDEFEVSEDEG